MNKQLKYPLFLAAVGSFSTFLLATAYGFTAPIIAQRIAEQATAGVKEIFPSASSIEDVSANYDNLSIAGINTIFEIKQNNQVVAYGYEARANGYSGEITSLLVLSITDDQIIGYRTINQTETKGGTYGDILLSNPQFDQQFVNLGFTTIPDAIDLTAGSTAKVTLNAIKSIARNVLKFHIEEVKGEELIIPEVLSNPLETIKSIITIIDEVNNLKETFTDAKALGLDIYEIKSNSETVAYGYVTVAVGFGGDIASLILIDSKTDIILNLSIIKHTESADYGGALLDSRSFVGQFSNMPISNFDNVDIEAGITVTENAFRTSIKQALNYHLSKVRVG
jgi:Na+-translocating ferredoxin:NAD+ oxidoreductase RnfG subunit